MDVLLKNSISIGLFGLIGIYCRFFLGQYFNKFSSSHFPTVTLGINVVGSFLIGVIYVLGDERIHISSSLKVGLMVGLLGGFTTFSAYSLEVALLFERNKIGTALSYLIFSPILSLIFTFTGIFFARKLF